LSVSGVGRREEQERDGGDAELEGDAERRREVGGKRRRVEEREKRERRNRVGFFPSRSLLPHPLTLPPPLPSHTSGHTSAASSISYLDKGFVFVGSRSGDSQLVRLHPEAISPLEPHNHVEVRA
jgi:hypothetical protein